MSENPKTPWVKPMLQLLETANLSLSPDVQKELLRAAIITLATLENMTTEDFQHGKDKPARDALAKAVTEALKQAGSK